MATYESQPSLTHQQPMIMWKVLFSPSGLPYIACPVVLAVLKAPSNSAAGCCTVPDA